MSIIRRIGMEMNELQQTERTAVQQGQKDDGSIDELQNVFEKLMGEEQREQPGTPVHRGPASQPPVTMQSSGNSHEHDAGKAEIKPHQKDADRAPITQTPLQSQGSQEHDASKAEVKPHQKDADKAPIT